MTCICFDYPVLAAGLWIVLHAADFYFTLLAARAYHRGAREVLQFGGSYELNPLFQNDVDKIRWFSPRFLITLVAVALSLFLLAVMLRPAGTHPGLPFLLGLILFTRLVVISRHVQNFFLFNRLRHHPEALKGSIRYGRKTIYRVSALSNASWGAVMGVAAVLAQGNPWLVGGSFGLFVMGAVAFAHSMRLTD